MRKAREALPRISEAATQCADPEPAKRTASAIEYLQVPFTRDEMVDLAERLARAGSEKQALEERFEVQKLDFKYQHKALEESIRSLNRQIVQRSHWDNVECLWELEQPTKQEKTLIRLDTGEIVKTVPMQGSDYQDPLPAVFKEHAPAEKLELTPPAPPAVNPANGNGTEPVH